jgi:hypothetical protein
MVQGKEQESSTNCIWEDALALFKLCRSKDKNLLLASVTKWEDMGCTPGTTPDPTNAQNAETKHQSGAVPNPTPSLIGFGN